MFNFFKSLSPEEKLKKSSMELDAIAKTMLRLKIQSVPEWLFWEMVKLQVKIDLANNEIKIKSPNDTTNIVKFSDRK